MPELTKFRFAVGFRRAVQQRAASDQRLAVLVTQKRLFEDPPEQLQGVTGLQKRALGSEALTRGLDNLTLGFAPGLQGLLPALPKRVGLDSRVRTVNSEPGLVTRRLMLLTPGLTG